MIKVPFLLLSPVYNAHKKVIEFQLHSRNHQLDYFNPTGGHSTLQPNFQSRKSATDLLVQSYAHCQSPMLLVFFCSGSQGIEIEVIQFHILKGLQYESRDQIKQPGEQSTLLIITA